MSRETWDHSDEKRDFFRLEEAIRQLRALQTAPVPGVVDWLRELQEQLARKHGLGST